MTNPLTDPRLAPIDALAPTVEGRYRDPLVTVTAVRGDRPALAERTVRTQHFDLTTCEGRLMVSHDVPSPAIDDDLAGLLSDELFAPGWLRGVDLFERLFTGVVRTSAEDALDSWELFYRNTLRHLDAGGSSGRAGQQQGSISSCAPVREHALALLAPGSVLELGCCFGFLSLRIAATGRLTTAASDSAGALSLLAAMCPRLGVHVRTAHVDAARFPGPDALADTVLAVHLLEHLEPAHGTQVVAEALRLATRRVVVAVPLEEEADETYGHVRTVSLDDLRRWGRSTGLPFDVHEHHGGWLVVDKR